ncbi:MAG: hypothetical protein M1283_01640 [Gammaproteobacteria bacterium]|nr:hypothetical protein [Gammaproteobacteria bacterium]
MKVGQAEGQRGMSKLCIRVIPMAFGKPLHQPQRGLFVLFPAEQRGDEHEGVALAGDKLRTVGRSRCLRRRGQGQQGNQLLQVGERRIGLAITHQKGHQSLARLDIVRGDVHPQP